MSDTRVISTRLDPDEALLVEIDAERQGLTRAEWLRDLIRDRLTPERHADPSHATRERALL